MKRWLGSLAALAVATGVVLSQDSAPSAQASPIGLIALTQRNHPDHFEITGETVNGLYPGATKPMRVTVSNPYPFPLRLLRVTGSVTATSSRGCPASVARIVVGDLAGLPVTVDANRRRTIGALLLTMPRGTSEKCAGTRFSLLLAGTATKVAAR